MLTLCSLCVNPAEVTDFPSEYLLADPTSTTYEALGLVKGVRQTFFGSQVSSVDHQFSIDLGLALDVLHSVLPI